MFIDNAKIELQAGNGGDGAVAFRREKYIDKGGPNGGDGGRGGNIIFETNPNLHTLQDIRYKKMYKAKNGQAGGSNNQTGKSGEDLIIQVPCGTIIKNIENQTIIKDLIKEDESYIICLGIVKYGEYQSFVMADIPGLIEGASKGKGLGHQFLKHIERNKILLFMIDVEENNPIDVYNQLMDELVGFNKDLLEKNRLIVRTKIDTASEDIVERWSSFPEEFIDISSVSNKGLNVLKDKLVSFLSAS